MQLSQIINPSQQHVIWSGQPYLLKALLPDSGVDRQRPVPTRAPVRAVEADDTIDLPRTAQSENPKK